MKKSKKDRKNLFIRSSVHSFPQLKQGKLFRLFDLRQKYDRLVRDYIHFFWNNKVVWNQETGQFFDIQHDCLDIPKVISTVGLPIETLLSGRMKKAASSQALGIIRAVTETRRKRLYIQADLKSQGIDSPNLDNKIDSIPLTMPKPRGQINMELDSNCADWLETPSGTFDGFISLHSFEDRGAHINIPLKLHRQANKWKAKGELLPSFLVMPDKIVLRWEMAKPDISGDKVVGADQGVSSVISLSDGQQVSHDKLGTSLNKIQKHMAKQKKMSSNFKDSEKQRKNFINWAVNQLDLDNIGTMKLEKVFRIGFGQRQSRFLAHWATMAIKEKIVMKCEEAGVLLLFQSSPYRSRRCSSCGYVNEKNRKGKIFRCLNPGCGNTDDADINAAKNHEDELPDLWRHPWLSKLSRGEGFYWKPEGLFNSLGEELTVHSHENRNKEDSDSSLGNQKLSKATNVI